MVCPVGVVPVTVPAKVPGAAALGWAAPEAGGVTEIIRTLKDVPLGRGAVDAGDRPVGDVAGVIPVAGARVEAAATVAEEVVAGVVGVVDEVGAAA